MKQIIGILAITVLMSVNAAQANLFARQGGLAWSLPSSKSESWNEANSYCNATTIDGLTGWRLPTKDELSSLYKENHQNPKVLNEKKWMLGGIWTSTLSNSRFYRNSHFAVNLELGSIYEYYDSGSLFISCVHSLDTSSNEYGLNMPNVKAKQGEAVVPSSSQYNQANNVMAGHESYEERSKRIIEESNQYQESSRNQQINASEQSSEFQHELRIVDFDGITSTLPDCPKFGEKNDCYGRDGEPGDGYLGEFKNNSYNGFGTMASKEKNIFLVGYFKDGDLQGRVRYSPLSNLEDVHEGIFNAGEFQEKITPSASPRRTPINAIGQNCELAKAQAYLTPVPNGSFAESQQYADRAYASCMANQPVPTPPVASPSVNTGISHFLKGLWIEKGNTMCRYDDGTVLNMGSNICPLSR